MSDYWCVVADYLAPDDDDQFLGELLESPAEDVPTEDEDE